jgi:acetyl-CoA C-acetyltransferase
MSSGIKDKVVILGMGCSRFGERWESGADDLMVEAYSEALADAGVASADIEAAWYATAFPDTGLGCSAVPAAIALRLNHIPVTRVENFCASGTEALRGAVYAVASGAADIVLAIGVEKLKDTGFGGLPYISSGPLESQWEANFSPPGMFAQIASAYGAKHGIKRDELKRALAHVSVKSHANALKNPKAHLHMNVTEEQALRAPIIAEPLGLFDCCGVSDGAACAIVTTPERARELGKKDLVAIKSIQSVVSNGFEETMNTWDMSYFHTTRLAARRAYAEAGIKNPRAELSMIEVHDCFSITELVTMEDLGISPEGGASRDVLNGFYDSDGPIPCQIDGGLKCFGHPTGASGLRMVYEMYLQLGHRAGPRQLAAPKLGLTHNLGGRPSANVAAIAILGHLD